MSTIHTAEIGPAPGVTREKIAQARQLRIGFALIPIGHSAGMNIITLLAFRFLTDNLAISAGAAGLMFAIVRIYDGVLDPAVGAWSDRVKTRWGRRLPFIFAGGIMMPLGIAMVFNTPDFGSVLMAQAFIVVALMMHASAYTALTIPSIAMLVEATDDYNDRTSLMAWRVFGNSLGVVLGSALPAWLLGHWGATRSGHALMSLVVAAIVLAAVMIGVFFLRHAPQTTPAGQFGMPAPRYGFKEQAKLAWSNRPFRILAIAHIFVLFGTAVTSIGSAYFSKYVLLLPDGYLGTYYMIATVGSVGSMPLWLRLSKAMGKKWTYIAAMAGFGLVHFAWLSAHAGEADWLLFLRALAAGVTSGGVILISYSMLSDAMRYDYIQTGLRREGAFAGFTTLFDKLSAAAAIAVMGAFLNAMGYVTSLTGKAVQPPGAILAIYICLALVPALAMLIAILTLLRYDLDEAALRERG
jgi:GPH family glycoside/pentoside/hexuronide:cation symporter